MRISDWSSDVCSSDLCRHGPGGNAGGQRLLTHRPAEFPADPASIRFLLVRPGDGKPDAELACGTDPEPAGLPHPGVEQAPRRNACSTVAPHVGATHPAELASAQSVVHRQKQI